MFPQVFGKYILERELSRGGMARVLLATLRGAGGFEKRLVVKQIREELCFDEQFVNRFVEEAKTTVALSHPNIVPVYELGVEQGTYFLAMELVEGVTVHELLRGGGGDGKRRRLSPEQGAYIGVEICRALDYAHRRVRVVHRDVTPRNVMVDEEGQVKVIDFGIAAPARVAGHEVFGSPGHMPPEQVAGLGLGPATDIFAVAVLLMEAWSGSAPFRRATQAACDAAMAAPHPKPSDADPRLSPLDDIILRAMQVDPKARPDDADELGRVLRKFISGVDAADVARDLGAHVRSVRKAIARKRAGRGPGHEWKPSQPSGSVGELRTKTFAAREEVSDWKSERPPAFQEQAGERGVAASAPDDAPRTRKMLQTPLTPVASSASSASSDGVETLATRPLETPVGAPEKTAPPPLLARTVPRSAAIALALAAIAAGALAAATASREPARGTPTTSTASAPQAPPTASARPTSPSSSAVTSSFTRSAPPPSNIPSNTPSNPTSSPPSTQAPLSSPLGPVVGGKAHLALFGDPGTLVAVDGTPRGAVPVRDVAVEPGTHDVLFTFEATGERRGDRITLQPGERVRLRADFTGAVPTIRVDR